MEKVSIIGIDLAKRSFQAHGADGGVALRKKLSREKVLAFLAEQSPFLPNNRLALSPWKPAKARITGGARLAIWATRFD